MKIQNTWPTHKARARGRNARHRAMIHAQRRTTPTTRRRPRTEGKGPDGAAR